MYNISKWVAENGETILEVEEKTAKNIDEMNQVAYCELVRVFDRLTANYDSIKVKILALIAGEVAIVPFIFSGDFPQLDSLSEVLFFSAGAALMAAAFAMLLWAASTADWFVPFGANDSKNVGKTYRNKSEMINFLKEDYEKCLEDGLKRIKKRAKAFNVALTVLVLGISILFVIKFT
jgi:hypothetical protein